MYIKLAFNLNLEDKLLVHIVYPSSSTYITSSSSHVSLGNKIPPCHYLSLNFESLIYYKAAATSISLHFIYTYIRVYFAFNERCG
jgi:hypothetical protein